MQSRWWNILKYSSAGTLLNPGALLEGKCRMRSFITENEVGIIALFFMGESCRA